MSVKIITDSGSDMSCAKDDLLECVPLNVRFGSEEYQDGVNLSHEEFYSRLEGCDTLPATSQPSPALFEEAMKRALAQHDEVVVITLSSKLSGTYQAARLAADDDERIHVVDSENVALGQRILVQLALELAKIGKSVDEIVRVLDEKKKDVRLIALLDTLDYLKKGGRVSSAAAFASSVLSIKPVIAIEEGEVHVIGKARGSKKGNNFLIEEVRKAGGIDLDLPFALGYTGNDTELIERYIADSKEILGLQDVETDYYSVGSAVGTHAGPGAIAVAFFAKSE